MKLQKKHAPLNGLSLTQHAILTWTRFFYKAHWYREGYGYAKRHASKTKTISRVFSNLGQHSTFRMDSMNSQYLRC